MADDLDELLSLIDEPAYPEDVGADVEARVWARLHGDAPPLQATAAAAEPARGRLLALVAASVLIVVGLLGVGLLRDDEQAPSDEPPPTTTAATAPSAPAVIVERADACARHRSDAGTLGDLGDVVASGDVAAAASSIERTSQALDVLVNHFEAGGEDADDVEALIRIRGAVTQAGLHLADGDAAAAVLAVEFAIRTYTGSELTADRCLG